MAREKHQDGWVVLSGKRVKKWIGHWMPYRADGTRSHTTLVLGEKASMKKWEAEDKLRAHIATETKKLLKYPEGEPTFQWFWERAYLPSRTWGPAMRETLTGMFAIHVLPVFGAVKLSDLNKLALQQHLNKLAESCSRSLVGKVLTQYRAILEEAVEQELIAKNPARKLAMPPNCTDASHGSERAGDVARHAVRHVAIGPRLPDREWQADFPSQF